MSADGSSSAAHALQVPTLAEVRHHVGDAAALLKALSNEQRLLLLCSLVEGPRSVGQLNERVTLSQSALSQHLAVLRGSGLVLTRRESQTVYYSLAPGLALKVLEALHAAYCAASAPQPSR